MASVLEILKVGTLKDSYLKRNIWIFKQFYELSTKVQAVDAFTKWNLIIYSYNTHIDVAKFKGKMFQLACCNIF